MEKINISQIDEDIYFEKLDNGLRVYLYNKEGVYNNYVTFTTKYGSIYNEFVPINESKMTKFPKGIAHFLEHKVFEQKEDPQPMDFFAQTGSICNAYTTFENTSFLFYATSNLKENINYLLDYVQNIYLTDKSVEEEKDIITEEIHMYDDKPSSILEEEIRKNSLVTSPYRDSVIGLVSDIENITKSDLETCYHTFYNPSNMFIVVTGNFNPEEILNTIKENQSTKEFKKIDKIKVKEYVEEDKVKNSLKIVKASTNIPKVGFTIKFPLKDIDISRRKLNLYMYILFSLLFDETSSFDEDAKNKSLISMTTGLSILDIKSHLLVTLVNSSLEYESYLDLIKNVLDNINIKEEDFERKKKILISNQILAYEDIELVNDIISSNVITYGEINDKPLELIKSLSFKELNNLIKKLDFKNTSTVILKK